jgi:uncharacterized protein (DUF427 family)
MENVWDYPRPPALEPVPARVSIVFGRVTIAATEAAWRVLETSHPPVYYLPRAAFSNCVLESAAGGSFCEWKGEAVYWDVALGEVTLPAAGWSYPDPRPGFEALREHVAFYAAPFDRCLVDGEAVTPQPGGFYGGWITSAVAGPFKGGPGSRFW